MYTPVYGELVSFGSYTFTAKRSFIADLPQKKQISDAYVLGNPYPVDVLAGGPAPFASTDITFVYWIVAPDGTAEVDCAPSVESAYNDLKAVEDMVATLTVRKVNSISDTVSCSARLVDSSIRESTREYSSMQVNLVFKCYGPFA